MELRLCLNGKLLKVGEVSLLPCFIWYSSPDNLFWLMLERRYHISYTAYNRVSVQVLWGIAVLYFKQTLEQYVQSKKVSRPSAEIPIY